MLPHDIGMRIPWLAEIEQDFGFRFLQTPPPGNPLESLDIARLSRATIGFVAQVRFRRISSGIGCHPKKFLHVPFAPDADRFHLPINWVSIVRRWPRSSSAFGQAWLLSTSFLSELLPECYSLWSCLDCDQSVMNASNGPVRCGWLWISGPEQGLIYDALPVCEQRHSYAKTACPFGELGSIQWLLTLSDRHHGSFANSHINALLAKDLHV